MEQITEKLPELPETAGKYDEQFLESMDQTLDILPTWTLKLNALSNQIEGFRKWILAQMPYLQSVISKADEIRGYVIPTNVTYSKEKIDELLTMTNQPFGLSWNSATDTYQEIGISDLSPQKSMRRCVVDENGNFLYYLHPDDSSKKEDGRDATADITGANGTRQVKVQIRKFYERRYKDGDTHYFLISDKPFAGAKVHPIFRKSGWTKNDDNFENEYAYVGAFEACLYDASVGDFVNNNKESNNSANIDTANDKLMSIVGKKPYSGITIVQARQMIANGGSKQYGYWMWDAINLLYLTEYKDFNSQEKIPGYTSGGNIDRIAETGFTVELGNKTGSIINNGRISGVSASTIVANSYRGIENFFGHLWKWTDGITISFGKPFVCDYHETYENNKLDGQYKQLKDSIGNLIQMPQAHGYSTDIAGGTFLSVANTGGNSLSKITDYYWYYGTNGYAYAVLLSAGSLNSGASVGAFCFYGYANAGSRAWDIAARS